MTDPTPDFGTSDADAREVRSDATIETRSTQGLDAHASEHAFAPDPDEPRTVRSGRRTEGPQDTGSSTQEALGDPQALTAAAAQMRADTAQQCAALTAQTEEAAEELLARAAQIEEERAAQEQVHLYLVAVEQEFATLNSTVLGQADLARQMEEADAAVARADDRLQEAEARASVSRERLQSLVAEEADWAALESARMDVATAEEMPRLVAPVLAQTQQARAALRQALDEQTEQVRVAWNRLRQLRATEGIEPPATVKAAEEEWRQQQRDAEEARWRLLWSPQGQAFIEQQRLKQAMAKDRARRLLLPGEARYVVE